MSEEAWIKEELITYLEKRIPAIRSDYQVFIESFLHSICDHRTLVDLQSGVRIRTAEQLADHLGKVKCPADAVINCVGVTLMLYYLKRISNDLAISITYLSTDSPETAKKILRLHEFLQRT